MARNKSKPPAEDMLPVRPVVPPVESGHRPDATMGLPKTLDFRLEDRPWRIEKFELFAAEFHLQPEAGWEKPSRLFCQFARDHTRQWVVVIRLFGVAPVLPPPGTLPDDLRCWSREELTQAGYDVQTELGALRVMWTAHVRAEERAAAPETKSTAITRPAPDLDLDDKVLEQFQFSERIFTISVWDSVTKVDMPRPPAENRMERDWFVKRVREWGKMLSDPLAGPVARDALMNDLYLRRLESEIATASTRDHDKLFDRKEALSGSYQDKVDRLQAMFPEMSVAGKVSFRAVISDLVVAHRDYYAHGDRRLIDKVFTATEMEFALRESQQVGMRHRFSLSIAIAECIHNFYDPDFRSQLKPAVLKRIDAGFRGSAEAARDAQSEPIIDLEKGVMPGEGDQFEDFNDATCPECEARISSAVTKCPHCGMDHPNDQPNKEEYV